MAQNNETVGATAYQGCIGWRYILVVFALVITAAVQPAAAQRLMARSSRDSSSGGPKPVPLVYCDEENDAFISQAESLIKEKNFERAIEILQALILKREGFVELEPGQFSALRRRANDVIAQMDKEGLDLYRSWYDPEAGKYFRDALAAGDLSLLQKIADAYPNTAYGPRALEAMGAIYFDSGRFYQAAGCWRAMLGTPDAPKAMLMAKLAMAYHLGGDKQQAAAAMSELTKSYADAKGVLGGSEQNLVEFVTQVQKMPATEFAVMTGRGPRGWPGEGGLVGGIGLMEDVDVVLSPRWRWPAAEPGVEQPIRDRLVIQTDWLRTTNPYYGFSFDNTLDLRNGHVRVRSKSIANPNYGSSIRGNGTSEFWLSPMIHPVIADDRMIVRTAKEIVALDLVDGSTKWVSSGEAREMVRKLPDQYAPYAAGSFGWAGKPFDMGRYALSCAEGKVFALGSYRSPLQPQIFQNNPALDRNNQALRNGSVLTALSTASGKMIWSIGCGRGDDDFIKNCTFLSAPTYSGGRLYLLAKFIENYHLVCLNAQTGSLEWKSNICVAPASNLNGSNLSMDAYLETGSVSAVVDGRVYMCNNAGVVACVDAQSGQPVWACQYPSTMDAMMRGMYSGNQVDFTPRSASPVIVARGRVICMPSDSQQLVVVSADNGSPAWSATNTDRMGQTDLTAIDEDRILLSGQGLVVRSVLDGKELVDIRDMDVVGRPAVTPKAIFASGAGKLLRMDLGTYAMTSMDLTAGDALLGTLLTYDGKLFAANALGICAYFTYEEARSELTRRVDAAKDDGKKFDALILRGQLAFNGKQFKDALDDYNACLAIAKDRQDLGLQQRMRLPIHRSLIALGNHADTPQKMVDLFVQAQACSLSEQETGHIAIRLAKAYERAEQFDKAVQQAQALADQLPQEELVDLDIGPKADDSVRIQANSPTIPGGQWAQAFIAKVIRDHGRACYAQQDAKAAEAFTTAKASGDPAALVAVWNKWPNAQKAWDALMAAAEIYYKRGVAGGPGAAENFATANQLLHRIHYATGNPQQLSATIALAYMHARDGGTNYASILLEGVRDLPGDRKVAFADIQGSLTDALARIDGGKLPKLPTTIPTVCQLSTPLREAFTIEDPPARIMRDQQLRPVRIGERVLLIRENRLTLVDTLAKDLDSTVQWTGVMPVTKIRTDTASYASTIAGLSQDGKVLGIIERSVMVGFDIQSAKIKWTRETTKDLSSYLCASVGDGKAIILDSTGQFACINLADGQAIWQARLPGKPPSPPATPAQIGGGMVTFVNNNGRTLSVYSMTNGKLLGKWEGKIAADAFITDRGLLVSLIDGELQVHDGGQLASGTGDAIWTRKYDDSTAMLLGCGGSYVVVSPKQAGNSFDVLAIVDGRKTGSFAVAEIGNQAGVPMHAQIDGDSVYVTCSGVFHSRRPPNSTEPWSSSGHAGMGYLRGAALQKYNLATGKREWNTVLDTDTNNMILSMPPTVGLKHVAVVMRLQRTDLASYCSILDAQTGQVAQRLDLGDAGGDPTTLLARTLMVGPAVMTDGRLVLETSEGVTVYGKE